MSTFAGLAAETMVDGWAVLLVSQKPGAAYTLAGQATNYLDAHYPPGRPYRRPFIEPGSDTTRDEMIVHTVAADGGVLYLQRFMEFFGDVLLYVADARKVRLGGKAKHPNPFGLILTHEVVSGSQVESDWLREMGVGLIIDLDTGRTSGRTGPIGSGKPAPKRFTTREAWDESNDDGFDGLLDLPSFRRRR